MAAEITRLPVYVRIGDGPELEAGTVELEAGEENPPDLARIFAGAPYPLDFKREDHGDRLRDLAEEVRRASTHTSHEQLIRNLEGIAREIDEVAGVRDGR